MCCRSSCHRVGSHPERALRAVESPRDEERLPSTVAFPRDKKRPVSHGKLSRAEEYIRGAVTLSSPPLIFNKLMEVLDNPRSGSTEVARVLAEDHSLTVRILVIVNSAFFALPWRVDSISSAVTVVGTRQIRDMALATLVLTLFGKVPCGVLDVQRFRRHSLACGVLARTSPPMSVRATWSPFSSPDCCMTSADSCLPQGRAKP